MAASAASEHCVRQLLTQGYPSKLKMDDCNINTIYMAANCHDWLIVEIIEQVVRYLSKAVAIIINLFNPTKDGDRR